MTRSANGVELALDGGSPFHVTTSAVTGERLITVVGSTSFAVIWEERDTGAAVTPWYAVWANGHELGTVKPTSYELLLKRATFDPLRAAPSFASSPLPEGGDVCIVQFVTQPLDAYTEALRVWIRVALQSFGGPAGQIALMQHELVDERKWIDEPRFLNALNFCMLLPGPEAMQLATYVGWRLHGLRGGLAAGLLFVMPGALVVLALSMLYAAFGKLPAAEAVFVGVKAAVLAIVMEALLRIAKRSLKTRAAWLIAGLAFVAIYFLSVPFPLIVLAAALTGFLPLVGPFQHFVYSKKLHNIPAGVGTTSYSLADYWIET